MKSTSVILLLAMTGAIATHAKIPCTKKSKVHKIKQKNIDTSANEMGWLAPPETELIPEIVNNKVIGFKFWKVSPDTFAEDLGLKANDVFTAIDGETLDGPSMALDLMERVKSEKKICLSVKRGKKTLHWYVVVDK